MIFECEEVHIVADDGTVEALGVEWTEAKVFAEKVSVWLAHGLAMLGFVAGLVTAAAWIGGGTDFAKLSGLIAVGLIGAGLWTAWDGARMEGKRQQMLFHADGSVSTSKDGVWNTRLTDIANIEYVQLSQKKKDEDLPYTHGVRVIAKRGRVIHVAKNLEPDDAAGLAVMLTEAREAMRYIPAFGKSAQQPGMVW